MLYVIFGLIIIWQWLVSNKLRKLEKILREIEAYQELEQDAIDELYDEVFPDEICLDCIDKEMAKFMAELKEELTKKPTKKAKKGLTKK